MSNMLATGEVGRELAPSPTVAADVEKLPQVIEFLGGEQVMRRKIESKLDVHILIRAGFPNGVVTFLKKNTPELRNPGFLQKALGLSERTSQRKSSAGKLLTVEQSSKAWNFAEVMTQAITVFGSNEEAIKWLNDPALALEGERPIDLLSTSAGYDLVKDLLTRLEYGVYA